MSSASQEADCALKELVALYDDGNLRSMIEGVVGKVLVSPGSVVRPGEPMIKIVGKHRFVVAWFPLSRLYRLQVGDAVTVSTGGASLPDKIAKVSVIADAPPKEFQKAFAPKDGTRWLETRQRDHMGESSPAVADSEPTTGLPRVVCEAFYADSNIERSPS
jgi:multidrug resistance efflux pump